MIELHQLTKRYGDKLAVDGISATIPPGVVTGFLGPNGAGKSTTMRMILGLDRPTSGAALVNGQTVRRLAGPTERSPTCTYLLKPPKPQSPHDRHRRVTPPPRRRLTGR